MSDLILPARTQFRFNSKLLSIGLGDLRDEDARWRPKRGEGRTPMPSSMVPVSAPGTEANPSFAGPAHG